MSFRGEEVGGCDGSVDEAVVVAVDEVFAQAGDVVDAMFDGDGTEAG